MLRQALLTGWLAIVTCTSVHSQETNLVLRGTVKGDQNQTYLEVPFEVPAGTVRLNVSFHYLGKEQGTTLDIGVQDPQRFRGWSGGNKSSFTISTADATPSYLPGNIPPGIWKLLIGVPNIRRNSIASYEADFQFQLAGSKSGAERFSDAPLLPSAGWYRGDLHMHTAHSDGHCQSQTGKQVPCPVFVTLHAAAGRGLDFVAVTDHNTISHYDALRELQPYFDRLLLIPGREITTFEGHANVYGSTEFLDFRVGSSSVPDMDSLLQRVGPGNSIVSINHPNAPSGEVCMGCGWHPKSADMRLVAAVEAVNGGAEEAPYSGIPFWEKQLNAGYKVTAIGGSDNHDPDLALDQPGSVGSPTTVVFASELSVDAILRGIRSGRVFVDLTASRDRQLDFAAQKATNTVVMGETLHAISGERLHLSAHVLGCQGSLLRISVDGDEESIPRAAISSSDQTLTVNWRSDGKRHWLRADVISDSGKLQLLGNPVYINFPENPADPDKR